jgi:hypothetical protein
MEEFRDKSGDSDGRPITSSGCNIAILSMVIWIVVTYAIVLYFLDADESGSLNKYVGIVIIAIWVIFTTVLVIHSNKKIKRAQRLAATCPRCNRVDAIRIKVKRIEGSERTQRRTTYWTETWTPICQYCGIVGQETVHNREESFD